MFIKTTVKLIIPIFIILVLVAGGYGLFIWFVINIMKGTAAYGLLFVATIAGIASFFNPCAFPLLPAYLAQYYTTDDSEAKAAEGSSPDASSEASRGEKSTKHIFISGLAAALGVVTFILLLGIVIGVLGAGFGKSLGLVGENPSISVRWLRGIVGVLLLYLGFSHATGKGNPFEKLANIWHPKPLPKEKQAFRKLFSYGFGYTLLVLLLFHPTRTNLFLVRM